MIPKIMSLYLPQFHEVKENNEWYGDGFTDWVAVRKAEPLFEGHMQPKKPLNHNYYDLTNIETLKWQASLAKEYGVDGFCFYHYWFDSGNRLLEKPAELLLQHKEIDISYCFSWANESWKRTWSNVEKGNVWCNLGEGYDRKENTKDRGVLVKQRYGREKEWEKHIQYFLPFFKDERYLKVDGKPVLCIYQPCDIFCLKAMLEGWKKKLNDEGFKGIYLVGASYGEAYSGDVDISYDHEPGTAFNKCRKNGRYLKSPEGMELFDYDAVWEALLGGLKKGRLSCAFTGFDASPRKGYKSTIVKGSTPEKFEYYFTKFIQANMQLGNELVFINAWNEWGEGMYLEPCEDYDYRFLKAVRQALQSLSNTGRHWIEAAKDKEDELSFYGLKPSKGALQVGVLNQWLTACRYGIHASDFFHKYGYSKIAIYGMGILGRQLREELAESNIQILYYIDRADIQGEKELKKISMDEELPEADCIVVTPVEEFGNIYQTLREKGDIPIVDISEIFDDLL